LFAHVIKGPITANCDNLSFQVEYVVLIDAFEVANFFSVFFKLVLEIWLTNIYFVVLKRLIVQMYKSVYNHIINTILHISSVEIIIITSHL
jgi:hypothetical protein